MKLAPTTTTRCAASAACASASASAWERSEHAWQIRAGHVEATRATAARDQHGIGVKRCPVVEHEGPGANVEPGDNGDAPLDDVLLIELGRAQRQPLGLELAGEEVLAQVGPVVGPAVLGADHEDASDVALLAQRLDGGRRSRAAADDREEASICSRVAGVHRHGAAAARFLGAIDVHVVAVDAHAKGGDTVECRRLEQVAAAKVALCKGQSRRGPLRVPSGSVPPQCGQRAAVA